MTLPVHPTSLRLLVTQACRRWAYASTSWERTSGLAPAVLHAAEQQDQVALGIQRAVIPALVDSAVSVVKQAQLGSPFDVVLAGKQTAGVPSAAGPCTRGGCGACCSAHDLVRAARSEQASVVGGCAAEQTCGWLLCVATCYAQHAR